MIPYITTPPTPRKLTSVEARDFLIELAKKYQRVGVTGVPGSGKSKLCHSAFYHSRVEQVGDMVAVHPELYRSVNWVECDDLVRGLSWVNQEKAVRERINQTSEPTVFDGVTVARCLRHSAWLDAVVVIVNDPRKPQQPGAERLGKQVAKWVAEGYRQDNTYDWFPILIEDPS